MLVAFFSHLKDKTRQNLQPCPSRKSSRLRTTKCRQLAESTHLLFSSSKLRTYPGVRHVHSKQGKAYSFVPRYWHTIPRLCVFGAFDHLSFPRRLVGCEHF